MSFTYSIYKFRYVNFVLFALLQFHLMYITWTQSLARLKCTDVCTHSPQCIIREPLPPPFPSITFLYNEESQYHTHMMQWSKEEFAGCGRCFSIENENYGCKDCRWLKFWYGRHGQTHGFPDLANWIYRKYL